jgi:hypothetical protein
MVDLRNDWLRSKDAIKVLEAALTKKASLRMPSKFGVRHAGGRIEDPRSLLHVQSLNLMVSYVFLPQLAKGVLDMRCQVTFTWFENAS